MKRLQEERLDEVLHAGVTERDAADGGEAERVRLRLAQMRNAASLYAEAAWQSVAATPARRQNRGVTGGLLGVAAAAMLVAAYPVLQHRPTAKSAVVEPARLTVQPEASDEALLDGIRSDLSATIPTALRPLAATASARQRRATSTRKD